MAQEFVGQASPATTVNASTRTLLSMRTAVRKNLLGDADFFTDAQIDYAINRAYRKIAETTNAYITSSTQSTVSGTYLYDFPADYIDIKEVIYDNFRLDKDDLSEFLNTYSSVTGASAYTGIPTKWTDYNMTQLWLYPTPADIKDLVIYYSTYPAELTADGDISVFNSRGDDYMINFATADLCLLDNEMTKYQIYEKRYKEDLDHVKRNTKTRPQFTERSRDFDYPGGMI